MDKITPEHRSWNMGRIRSRNTSVELTVRSLLHRLGYRFRLHRKDLPGKPDIILPKHKTVIFVHGCFWHHHNECKYAYTPKTRVIFWENKFRENKKRDSKNKNELEAIGWNVIVIWECELDNPESVAMKLEENIKSRALCVSDSLTNPKFSLNAHRRCPE